MAKTMTPEMIATLKTAWAAREAGDGVTSYGGWVQTACPMVARLRGQDNVEALHQLANAGIPILSVLAQHQVAAQADGGQSIALVGSGTAGAYIATDLRGLSLRRVTL